MGALDFWSDLPLLRLYFVSKFVPRCQFCPRERGVLAASLSLLSFLPAPSSALSCTSTAALAPPGHWHRCPSPGSAPLTPLSPLPPASPPFVFLSAGTGHANPHQCVMANCFARRTGSVRPCGSLGSRDLSLFCGLLTRCKLPAIPASLLQPLLQHHFGWGGE